MPEVGPSEDPGEGQSRKWLWFRTSKGANSPAEKEFNSLPRDPKAALRTAMTRVASGTTRFKDVDHLGDGIYEVRVRQSNNHFRVLFFNWGPFLVALSAFYKNQRKTPQQDVDTAKDRRTRWRQAFGDERIAPPK